MGATIVMHTFAVVLIARHRQQRVNLFKVDDSYLVRAGNVYSPQCMILVRVLAEILVGAS